MDALAPGTLLGRRYRLLDRIGVGGMSVIWRANDEMLERGVAVKVLASDLAADDRFRALVRTEARAAAGLTHPHVTATYDYGETFNTDGEITAYVVMELLDGEPLSARLRDGALPWPEALRICTEVAEGIAAAHRRGVVHRDVTADNVMLTTSGAKILDFGIATTVGAPDEDSDGITFGTPAYVAPERLDGRQARPATDTYALGVLLFETLTGSPPFPAETWEELALTQREQPPPLLIAGLPPPVVKLCQQCLATDPQHRPTANQVAWTLRRHLPGAGQRGASRTQRLVATAGTAAALVVGLVLGATVLGSGGHPPGSSPEANESAKADPPDGSSSGPDPAGSPPSPSPATMEPSDPPAGSHYGDRDRSDPQRLDQDSGAESVTLHTVGELVNDGHARDDIREDVALDLTNLISNLQQEVEAGITDLASAAAQLRDKVQVRAAEGGLSPTSAATLEDALDRLTA